MATNDNQTNPGGIWDGLDGFLGFLTKARDAVFESWATYNLFSNENNYTGNVPPVGSGGSDASPVYWSDPNAVDTNKLLLWGGLLLGAGAIIYVVVKK
ncbi:MAG: hypothetical protein ACFCUQ_10085 [Kiloniellales bacterium]